MKNLFDVSGKVAVVTGGSRGIGAMIARGFVENGVKTYITARKEQELRATEAELAALGQCIAIPADVMSWLTRRRSRLRQSCRFHRSKGGSNAPAAAHDRQRRGRSGRVIIGEPRIRLPACRSHVAWTRRG